MYSYIKGSLASKAQDKAVIDVGGVGYLIYIPFSTYQTLPELNETVKLNTYLAVREDSLTLYGFNSNEELRIFIGDNWDTYAISRQEAINKAFKVGKYRSNNGHDSINLNKDEFDEASKLTLETLKWFANCYIYY